MINANARFMRETIERYKAADDKAKELKLNANELKKYDVFFGASKVFKQIFQKAALSNIQLLEEPIFGTIMYNMALG